MFFALGFISLSGNRIATLWPVSAPVLSDGEIIFHLHLQDHPPLALKLTRHRQQLLLSRIDISHSDRTHYLHVLFQHLDSTRTHCFEQVSFYVVLTAFQRNRQRLLVHFAYKFANTLGGDRT